MSIQIVDLRDREAPGQLDAALRADGFVQLLGHGVVGRRALWTAMDELFAQPLDVKLTWRSDDPLSNRGYRSRGSESLAYSLGQSDLAPDLFESFNLRHEARASDDPLMAAPIWPSELPTFRVAAEAYLGEMMALSSRLDRIFGDLLGLPDLASRSLNGPDAMACLRYQRGDDELAPAPNQARMGAHSDYTSFTILNADAVPGLEILAADGWQPVEPVVDALLLNVGDLFAMWTNDVWPSTLHRVPLRGGTGDAPLRRSVAYFHYPDLDTVVAPLEAWSDGSPRYEPVSVRNHLSAKLVGPKTGRRSEGAVTLGAREL